MPPLLPLLLPLLKRAEFYVVLVILLLLAACLRYRALYRADELALAQRPKVEFRERIVERKVQVKVAGPVRVVEHIVELPGGGRTIEREVDKSAVKTDTSSGRELAVDRREEPACPPAPRRWRHTVLDFAPGASGLVPVGLHGGVTLWDAFILEGSARWGGLDRIGAGVGVRW